MIVRMRVNLGTVDAESHGLDHSKLFAGAESEVNEAAGQWLVTNGHAEAVVMKGVAKAAAIQGVPPEPAKPKAKAKDAKASE